MEAANLAKQSTKASPQNALLVTVEATEVMPASTKSTVTLVLEPPMSTTTTLVKEKETKKRHLETFEKRGFR